MSSVTRLGDKNLGNFLKPLATINLPKYPTFLGIFVKVLKSIIFIVQSILGNFYRHLTIFFLVTLVMSKNIGSELITMAFCLAIGASILKYSAEIRRKWLLNCSFILIKWITNCGQKGEKEKHSYR